MRGEFTEPKEEISAQDVYIALDSVSLSDWEKANYPLVSYVRKVDYQRQVENSKNSHVFWKQVFNPQHYLNNKENRTINLDNHVLVVLHSFKNEGQDIMFKAITTSSKSLVEDPENIINYNLHGLPCENRSKGSYPTIEDFWTDFYDRLPEIDKDLYPIPDTNYRRNLIQKNI